MKAHHSKKGPCCVLNRLALATETREEASKRPEIGSGRDRSNARLSTHWSVAATVKTTVRRSLLKRPKKPLNESSLTLCLKLNSHIAGFANEIGRIPTARQEFHFASYAGVILFSPCFNKTSVAPTDLLKPAHSSSYRKVY